MSSWPLRQLTLDIGSMKKDYIQLKEKVRAIVETPTPRNVPEFRSYLGLLNYYGEFLPNLYLVTMLELLQKNIKS